jgi:RNA polymerase sigma-70 factor, ECF subfamily
MTPPDDCALLHRIAKGDQAAFQMIYSAYYPRLWRYAWYQLDGNVVWIEEVLQEIFLAIWRSAGKFRGKASAAAWIFQIAHHLVSNARRDHARRAEGHVASVGGASDDGNDERIWHSPSFEEATINRLMIIDAIDMLSPKHQAVIDLVFIQGFTLDEVAHILDVPLGTVKSRIINARLALRKAMGTPHNTEGPHHES